MINYTELFNYIHKEIKELLNLEDVVIIRAEPAGVAAAIQLKLYGIEPILTEKEDIGRLLKNANLVENYPGFS